MNEQQKKRREKEKRKEKIGGMAKRSTVLYYSVSQINGAINVRVLRCCLFFFVVKVRKFDVTGLLL